MSELDIYKTAFSIALNWTVCPLEHCEHNIRDCATCKGSYFLAAAKEIHETRRGDAVHDDAD